MHVPPQLSDIVRAHAWALTVRPCDLPHWRRTVASVLKAWGAPPDSAELACLGVTELLTNVLKHVASDPRCYLRIDRTDTGTGAVIAVHDRSSVLPAVTEPDWGRESGRGLWLLREMFGCLGCEHLPGGSGKRVWFRCDLGGQPRGDSGSPAPPGSRPT
ncbi:ATP-binding protein [Streptomyces marincola]|uniref:Histidine kinase/HSP90-like ATPase domain-containing protein n=1 Tax=Streptomyces marincola TaxID=2878388 RepID=A0A1W7D5A0_9ACTN|nr:ATP-binding protein [Streptomyces marincola]ARQ72263.1 hypothetical protein CAG99_10055 [Streptomyces marincola]